MKIRLPLLVAALGCLLIAAPAQAQSTILLDAARADICGDEAYGGEIARLMDSGLATVEDIRAAIRAIEGDCNRYFSSESGQARMVIKASDDMNLPISLAVHTLVVSGGYADSARIVTAMPRIAALAQYYIDNEVREDDVQPLADTISAWLGNGGDANLRLCSGTTLGEMLILAQAPRSTEYLIGAGADANMLTSRAIVDGQMVVRYGDARVTSGVWSVNFRPYGAFFFGAVTNAPQNAAVNACVGADSLPADNLSLFDLALWNLMEHSYTNGHRRDNEAILDHIAAGGGQPGSASIDIIDALGTAYLGGQAVGLEKVLSLGLDINTPSSSGQTLIQLAYARGAGADALRYLTGLGARLE